MIQINRSLINSKPTVPELEEILVPLQTSLADTQVKLRELMDKLAPYQKYDQSADVKMVSDEVAFYLSNVTSIINGDMASLQDKR